MKKLDTRSHPTHDQRVNESPSLLETIIGFPGAVLRLPSSALATLEAINEVTERMDRLMTLLDQLDRGVTKAGSGFDFAALGISGAVSGLEQAVGILDASLPSLAESASALRGLTERLSGVAFEIGQRTPQGHAVASGGIAGARERRRSSRRSLHPPRHRRE